MKKLLYTILLSFICLQAFGQWNPLPAGTWQRTADGFKYRTAFGASGTAFWYTKQQIDSLLGTIHSGVTSFNTRTGAVTLNSADVTTALGFTPENVTNKVTTFGTLNNILYPTTQAVANYVTSVLPTNSTPNQLGKIYSAGVNTMTTAALAANFISSTGTVVTSGSIIMPGATTTNSPANATKVRLNVQSELENWSYYNERKMPVASSTTYPVGVGSSGTQHISHGFLFAVGNRSGSNGKSIVLWTENNSVWSVKFTTTAQFAVNDGDEIATRTDRIQNKIKFSAWDLTTNGPVIDTTYTYLTNSDPFEANVGTFALFNMGSNTAQIDSINITSTETVNASLMILGDSQFQIGNVSDPTKSVSYLLGKHYPNYVRSTGGGDDCASIIAKLPQLKKLNPTNVLGQIGYNDLSKGQTTPQTFTSIKNIDDSLRSYGYNVWWTIQYATTENMQPLRDSLITYFGPLGRYVDTYSCTEPLGNLDIDGIHATDAGHYLKYKMIQQSTFFTSTSTNLPQFIPYVSTITSPNTDIVLSYPTGLQNPVTTLTNINGRSISYYDISSSLTGLFATKSPILTFTSPGNTLAGTNVTNDYTTGLSTGQTINGGVSSGTLTIKPFTSASASQSGIFDLNGFTMGGGASRANTLFQGFATYINPSVTMADYFDASSAYSTVSAVSFQLRGFVANNSIAALNTQNWTSASGGLVGFDSSPRILSGATGIATSIYAFNATVSNLASGATLTSGEGYKVTGATASGSNITNFIGFHSNALTTATNNMYFGAGFATGSQPTGNWGINLQTAYTNYFGTGNNGFGVSSPTGVIHLKAGTATASTAPLKFTSGINLTTTEAGAIEYDGSHLYFTATNAGTRFQLDQQTGGGTTTNSITGNNSGSGAASGSTFNGASAVTWSYNTFGASPLAGSSSFTTIGTIGSSSYTTAGIIHNSVTTGAFTSSLIVNSDITNSTIDVTSKITGIVPSANLGSGGLGTGTKALFDDGTFKVPSGGSGTVTSVSAGYGMNFTTITASGPVAVDSTIIVNKTFSGRYAKTNTAATFSTVNGNTFTTGTYTLTGTAAKTLNFTNSLTLTGTDATTMTFPTTSATIARTDAGQTFTGTQTFTSGAANISISGVSIGLQRQINATPTTALLIENTQPATSGSLNQYSQSLAFLGATWNTSGTPASNTMAFEEHIEGVSSGTPTASIFWSAYVGTSTTPTYTKAMSLDNSGNLSLLTGKLNIAGLTASLPVFTDGSKNLTNTGIVPVANGGTGSATQNFVDLTTNQTIAGNKTFSNTSLFNGATNVSGNFTFSGTTFTLSGFTGTNGALVNVGSSGILAEASNIITSSGSGGSISVGDAAVSGSGAQAYATAVFQNTTPRGVQMPLGTTTQRNAISFVGSTNASGLLFFDTTVPGMYEVMDAAGATWRRLLNTDDGIVSNSAADLTAQTTAGTIKSITTDATGTVHTYRIGAYLNITAVTVDVIETQVTYTDENNTSQTANFFTMGATSALLSAIGNSAYPTMDIRVKAGTTLTVKTTLTTGTGSINFDCGTTLTELR